MQRTWDAIRAKLKELVSGEEGQNTTLEYALFGVLIALVCIIALSLMFESVRNIFAAAPAGIRTTT